MFSHSVSVVQISQCAPTPACVRKHCVGSVKKSFPSAAAHPAN